MEAVKKYLALNEVTNMYAQFGLLSPEDKIIVNNRMAIKSQMKRLNHKFSKI
jgi:hypothetical protein